MEEKLEKVQPGTDTDAILTLLKLSCPPERKENEGVCSPELARELRITKHRAIQTLKDRGDLLPVLMINYNGRKATIYIPKEDAEKSYPDWIIKDSS
jgi:hypothetical protein